MRGVGGMFDGRSDHRERNLDFIGRMMSRCDVWVK